MAHIPVLLPGEFMDPGPGGLQSMGSHRVGHDCATFFFVRRVTILSLTHVASLPFSEVCTQYFIVSPLVPLLNDFNFY